MQTLDIESLTLTKGSHEGPDEGYCLMEAVAFIAGEPWSGSPKCASPVISFFLRSYNDSVNDEARQSLKQYIPRLIGTSGSYVLEQRRSLIAADWLVRVHTPPWLRLAKLVDHADAFASLLKITSSAQISSMKGPIQAAKESAFAVIDAARAAAGTWDEAAARDGSRAGKEAWLAVMAAGRDAAWHAAMARNGTGDWAVALNAAVAQSGAGAWVAAWDGIDLQPTVDELQATIPTLIERMLTAT